MVKYNEIIIIFIIVIFLVIYLLPYKEDYDGRVKNISTIEDCADIASSIYQTSAFAYNPDTKSCYISKTSLTRPPIQIHPYHNDFKISDIICNKLNYIQNSENKYKNNMIANRYYYCYNNTVNIDDNIDQYYFEQYKPKKLISYEDPTELHINNHDLFKIDWPIEKSQMNDIRITYDDTGDNNKKIKKITWNPMVEIIEPKKSVYDIYDDKNNFSLFKIKENTCL